jgi:hypothetical protein
VSVAAGPSRVRWSRGSAPARCICRRRRARARFPLVQPVALVPPPPTPECRNPVSLGPEQANAALRHTLDAIGAEKLREHSAWSLAHLLYSQFAPAAAARPSGGAREAPRLRDVRRGHSRRQKAAELLGLPTPPAPARLRPVTRIGPFLPVVPTRRRITNPPTWETGVLYGAVYAARVATAKPPLAYQNGTQMPKDGRPLYAVAAAFLRDLSGADLHPFQVGKRIQDFTDRNPAFRWLGWRHNASPSAVSTHKGL